MPKKINSGRSLPPTARSLPIALIRAREAIMSPIRDMLADSDITEQQWRVLRVLAEHGPQDSSTLASLSSLLFPSLTRIARSMHERGLIKQTRDATDRRRQIVAITPLGQEIIDRHTPTAVKIVEGFKESLGDENYETLLDLLDQLHNNQDQGLD